MDENVSSQQENREYPISFLRDTYRQTIEQIKEYSKIKHEQETQSLSICYKGLFDCANAAIRGVFILNGSAAVAILYNLRYLPKNDALSWILLLSAGGALFAVISSGLICLAQRCYFDADYVNFRNSLEYYGKLSDFFILKSQGIESEFPNMESSRQCYGGKILMVCSVVCWVLSLLVFGAAILLFFVRVENILLGT